MNTEEIINRHKELSKELYMALSTMTRKDTIYNLKAEMLELQNTCSHIDNNYNWAPINGYCPYCGKKLTNS